MGRYDPYYEPYDSTPTSSVPGARVQRTRFIACCTGFIALSNGTFLGTKRHCPRALASGQACTDLRSKGAGGCAG